jgi:hypothetical protein
MLQLLSKLRDAPNITPFRDWTRRVREYQGSVEENPARRLIDFLEGEFVAMSCGDPILETMWSRRHSHTLTSTREVSEDLVRLYVRRWKESRFLN